MDRGIIYFLQPCELVGTFRYKIGCSKICNLNRCQTGYRKGTRYLCIMECINPLELERNIKNIFNKKKKEDFMELVDKKIKNLLYNKKDIVINNYDKLVNVEKKKVIKN